VALASYANELLVTVQHQTTGLAGTVRYRGEGEPVLSCHHRHLVTTVIAAVNLLRVVVRRYIDDEHVSANDIGLDKNSKKVVKWVIVLVVPFFGCVIVVQQSRHERRSIYTY
jgi:hypothetical protein